MSDLTKAQRQRIEALQVARDIVAGSPAATLIGKGKADAIDEPLAVRTVVEVADYVLTGLYLDPSDDGEVLAS